MRIFSWIGCLGATVFLSGCLIPENFTASVSVKPDGRYIYRYDGTVVHGLAAAAMKEKGSLAAKDEAGLKKEADQAAKNPDFKKIDYKGGGRYSVQIEQELPAGQQANSVRVFSVTKDAAGIYSIKAPAIKAKEQAELKSLGIKVNGKAEVVLPANAKVISHNATGTPGIFSKTYSWKIGSFDDQPTIQFSLNK